MDDQFSEKAKQAEKNVSGLESSLTRLGGIAAGAFSVAAIVNFGKSVIDAYGKAEMFKTSLTTMLHGNAIEAEALNRQLVQLAKTTPFQIEDIQSATRQLIAYGSEAGKVGDEIVTLGNVASGIGAPLGDIAYLYGTIRTQGRAMTVDINQFANRGIPIWKELEKITGKTGLNLRKMVEEGKIGFQDIQSVFRNLTSEGGQFFNLMEQQSKTVTGQISNLGDAWEQLKVSIGESQQGILKDTIQWAANMVQAMNNSFQRGNFISKSLTAHGGKKTAYLGGSESTQAEIESIADMVRSSVAAAGKSPEDAQKQITFLKNFGKIQNARFLEQIKGIKDQNMLLNYYAPQQNNRLALIKEGLEEIKGVMELQKSKATPEKKDTEIKKKEAEKVKTPHYTQINIQIDQMTGIGQVVSKDNKELPPDIGEEILKLMTKGVTDAQIIAGARI